MTKKRYLSAVISIILIITTVFSSTMFAFAETTTPPENEVANLPINEEIVEIARSKIGFYESNANEFTEWYYGYPTDAWWCTIFVSWCGAQVGEAPDPSKDCTCNCHKDGISKFFFDFALFFQKIFRLNSVCKCGVRHY